MNQPVTGAELSCREIIDFIMAYLDGELPPRERAIFDAHLALCRHCVNYLTSYQATIALGKAALSDPELKAMSGTDVPEDLIKAILAARQG